MQYDLVIIGSGPGGYVCAIRSAQLGLKVALVEKYNTLGGTCLNVGCIPSKALLNFSEVYFHMLTYGKEFGVVFNNPIEMDIKKMMEKKDKLVKEICYGIDYLMKKNKIDVYYGIGQFLDKKTIKVTGEVEKILHTKYTVIATGSKPLIPKNMSIDKKRILSSTDLLNLKKIPESLLLVGGGVIAVELGSVFSRLGTKVILLEGNDYIVPTMDEDISKELSKILSKDLKMDIYVNSYVKEVKNLGDQVEVKLERNGKEEKFKSQYVAILVGRVPYVNGLKLENVGIQVNKKNQIPVNKNLETEIPDIYAIGDVIEGPMLAHKASEEGIFVAEVITGQKPHMQYHCIPSVIYTSPEVATVGYMEKELIDKGIGYKVGYFPFQAIGRARVTMNTKGFVKVVIEENTDEILSISIIGERAGDIISTAVVAMEYRSTSEDIGRICFAHPTFSEALKEACLSASKRSIHI